MTSHFDLFNKVRLGTEEVRGAALASSNELVMHTCRIKIFSNVLLRFCVCTVMLDRGNVAWQLQATRRDAWPENVRRHWHRY